MRQRHASIIQVVVLGLATAGALGAGAARQHRPGDCLIRVSSRHLAGLNEIAVGSNPRTDYGAFSCLTVKRADVARLRALGVPFQERPDAFRLRLGGQAFDPLGADPALPIGWDRRRSSGSRLQLVQFSGPTLTRWLDDLERDGVRVVQHIPPFSYLVWGDGIALARAARRAQVRWTGPFLNGYKVPVAARNLDANPRETGVLLYRGADTDAAVAALRLLGGKNIRRRNLTDRLELVSVVLPGSGIGDVSLLAGVISVQPVPTDGGARSELSSQVNVNNVDASNRAAPGYLAWLQLIGLSGQGVTIGSVDEGAQESHPDLVNRFLPCFGETCGGTTQSPHGTRTAGIIAGDGSSGVVDAEGLLRGLGVAPGAYLIEQLFGPFISEPVGMSTLIQGSYANGATLSNNSWGPAGSPQGYDQATLQVDIMVRDADPNTPGNQQFTYVLAIMNGSGSTATGEGKQGSPDEAKNCLTIGSTKLRTIGGAQDLNIDDLSSNTAHGPALDGRLIPHMVAPGCYVDGPVPNGYSRDCGTSFAAPQVAGAIALFIERWRGLPETVDDPTPAMIKAAFLGAARSLEGHRDANNGIMGHPFDSRQGWGRLDAEAVLDPAAAVQYFDDPMLFDETGQEWAIDVTPDDPTQPMRLMLVWTDAPGHGLGEDTPAWNNDLDLIVEVDSDWYLGNDFGVDGWSQTGGTADFKNNTEGVFLGPTAPSSITVRVVAADINSDGVPGVGDTTDQDFSLVCYNCSAQPAFALIVSPTPVDICVGQEASFTVDTSSLLGFSDPVTLSVSGEPAGSTATFSVSPVAPDSSSVLTIANTVSVAPGSYVLTIDGVASSITRRTTATLNVLSASPDPLATQFPTHRSNNIVPLPLFTWDAIAEATSYEISVARDEDFLDPVVTASATGLTTNSFAVLDELEHDRTYYWRVKASNVCGEGGFSPVSRFKTRFTPGILLVDDDADDPNLVSTYEDALGSVSQAFDVRDLVAEQEPDASTLAQYDTVIWYTGAVISGPPGPSAEGEAALASYLDGGGCLLISSQDYEFGRTDFAFSETYLGIASNADFAGHNELTGTGLGFAGLGPIPLEYSDDVQDFTNTVTPDSTAVVVFEGQSTPAAIAKDTGFFRSTYWAFPVAAVADDQHRVQMLNAFLDWCSQPLYSQHPDFIDCMRGPGAAPLPEGGITVEECERLFDDDDDRDLDLRDYAKLQRSLRVTVQ